MDYLNTMLTGTTMLALLLIICLTDTNAQQSTRSYRGRVNIEVDVADPAYATNRPTISPVIRAPYRPRPRIDVRLQRSTHMPPRCSSGTCGGLADRPCPRGYICESSYTTLGSCCIHSWT